MVFEESQQRLLRLERRVEVDIVHAHFVQHLSGDLALEIRQVDLLAEVVELGELDLTLAALRVDSDDELDKHPALDELTERVEQRRVLGAFNKKTLGVLDEEQGSLLAERLQKLVLVVWNS